MRHDYKSLLMRQSPKLVAEFCFFHTSRTTKPKYPKMRQPDFNENKLKLTKMQKISHTDTFSHMHIFSLVSSVASEYCESHFLAFLYAVQQLALKIQIKSQILSVM